MPVTRVRFFDPEKGVEERVDTYTLAPREAVIAAYAAWKCGGVRTGMPDFTAALEEGARLIQPVTPGFEPMKILSESRYFYGFPEKEE